MNSKTSVRRSIATEVAEKLLGGAATSPGPKPNEIKEDANMTISTTEYQSQPGQATFAYVYPVKIGVEDVLEVKVTCSIIGSKTAKLDMRKTPR